MNDRLLEVPLVEIERRYGGLRLIQPEQIAEMRRSIARHGVLSPLVVHADAERPRRLVLIDGYKRARALIDDAGRTVTVRVLVGGVVEALGALLTCNRGTPGLSSLEEGWVVRELVRTHNLTQKAVATLLDHDTSWVCRRLQLAEELSALVQEDMRLGLVSSSVAREVVKLPRGNQSTVAESIRRHGLTARQASILVGMIQECTDDAARSAVLADPLKYVRNPNPTPPRPGRDVTLTAAGEAVRVALLGFDQSGSRASAVLRRYAPSGVTTRDALGLSRAFERALRNGADAIEQIASLRARHQREDTAAAEQTTESVT